MTVTVFFDFGMLVQVTLGSLCAGEPSILSENVVDVQTLPFLWFGGSVMHYGLPFLQDRSLGDIQDC